MEPTELAGAPRSRVKGPLGQAVAPDQELMGPPEASGALDQGPVGLLCRPWGPLRPDGA